MQYQPSDPANIEEEASAADLDLSEEGAELDADKELDAKVKARQSSRRSLEVRRAIEEHMEAKKLREELDYLFDEHFIDDGKSKR